MLEKLKHYVKEHGLKGKIRVTKSGCLDLCQQGINIFIQPDGIWLKGVREEDVGQIIEQYLKI